MSRTPIEQLFAYGLDAPLVALTVGVSRQTAHRWRTGEDTPRAAHQLKAKLALVDLRKKRSP
jgi:hypothetical protein